MEDVKVDDLIQELQNEEDQEFKINNISSIQEETLFMSSGKGKDLKDNKERSNLLN